MSRISHPKPKAFILHSASSQLSAKDMNKLYNNYLLLLKLYNYNKAQATTRKVKAPLWALQKAKSNSQKDFLKLWTPSYLKSFLFKLIRSGYSVAGE